MPASQRPRLRVAPRRRAKTFGDIAADFAADYGLIPDPWQQLVLDDWLAADRAGKWMSLTCGLSCPRQNGKNGIIEVRELFGMVGLGEKILHTAHEVKTARKAFKRLQFFFGRQVKDPAARFPELNDRVIELRNVNGQEAIYLENGGSVEIVARSKNSGRGFTADVLVMDEAQELSDEDLEALMPTTSAAPLGNPQWIFTGTPPGPKVNGVVFTRTRLNALGESPGRSCWHEWSACDPQDRDSLDLDDRRCWERANPSLGANRPGELQIDVIEGERAAFTDDGFARERLGVWDDPAASAGSVVPGSFWTLRADPGHTPQGALSYALDVDLNADGQEWCSIAVSDGIHVEIVTPPDAGPGLGWVVDACVAKRDVVDELAIDPSGPAGKLVGPLEAAGVKVRRLKADEMVQASGQFVQAVIAGPLVHLDQSVLNRAVAGAAKRDVGDGAWKFSRTKSRCDISPLMAVTVARWAAMQTVDVKPVFAY